MTGIGKLKTTAYAAHLEGRDEDEATLMDLVAQIERETLPRPLFEDGKPVQFGDEFVAWNGTVGTVSAINVVDNARLIIINSSSSNNYIVGAKDSHGRFAKRPEPKVLDRDGVPIEVGDKVWGLGRTQHEYKVLEPASGDKFAYGRFTVKCVDLSDSEQVVYADPSSLTHKRPEPPDCYRALRSGVEYSRDGAGCCGLVDRPESYNADCLECEAFVDNISPWKATEAAEVER